MRTISKAAQFIAPYGLKQIDATRFIYCALRYFLSVAACSRISFSALSA